MSEPRVGETCWETYCRREDRWDDCEIIAVGDILPHGITNPNVPDDYTVRIRGSKGPNGDMWTVARFNLRRKPSDEPTAEEYEAYWKKLGLPKSMRHEVPA